ncbi:MAG TPA: TRAP transporter substrate-binding protein [Geminicoccaceae bacterium]|nr:TRAP transporter substrate-binding protein [Geminicoccaceae bacterium]
MSFVRTALVAAAAAVGLSSAAFAETKWIMASGYPEDNFHTQNMRMFIAEVEEKTDGALRIELHPNDTLIKLDSIKRAVQIGQVPIGEIRIGVYGNEDPMNVLESLPFVAPDYESAWKLMEAQKPYFDEAFGRQNIKVLGYSPWPGQGFYTKFPVESVEDFRGKRLRIYSTATQQMGEMLGFEATILPFAEVPQAFATGLIEALFTSAQTGIDTQAWDNTDYFTYAGAMFNKNAIIVNRAAFEALDPEIQRVLIEAGENATERGWRMSEETNEAQMKTLAENGMTVTEAPPEVVERMREVGEVMTENWKKEASPEAVEALENYLATRDQG